jgi:predicted Zn-dependent protease with MMP-like domain
MKRMSFKKFGRLVARVMETLPAEFKPHLENLVVVVEEEPDLETLRGSGFTEKEIEEGEPLFGLWETMELPTVWSGDAVDVHAMEDRLIIYKRPLEEEFPDRRQLLIEIRKTVVHELAHHFGWSEEDLEQFDDTEDPFGDDGFVYE